MITYIIISVLIAGLTAVAGERWQKPVAALFYAVQAAFAAYAATWLYGTTSAMFFTFDPLGVLFFALMAIVSPFAFVNSFEYLRCDTLREKRFYHVLMILLCTAISAVYFANNIAVTWIFLEATTLCAAGLIYHRRAAKNLEATWKYIFVCSTGVATAYLGILLLCSAAGGSDISYAGLVRAAGNANPLYLKIAFVLILAGYSCKMEIFPLYPIGVDANYSAPAPAASLISTVLVNAGFLAIFRVYRLMAATEVFEWVQHVMVAAGVVSLLVGALFLRQTNNYKRFFSYSTVENMGIAAIGLGVGGVGLWAAVFHVTAHTFIKSAMFQQVTQIGRTYGNYRINKIGDYININKTGAVAMLLGTIILLAFPPSPLFVSEVAVLKQIIVNGQWWLAVVTLLLLCIVIYSLCNRMLKLCYQENHVKEVRPARGNVYTWTSFALLFIAMILGVWQPAALVEIINEIVAFGI